MPKLNSSGMSGPCRKGPTIVMFGTFDPVIGTASFWIGPQRKKTYDLGSRPAYKLSWPMSWGSYIQGTRRKSFI